MQLSGNTILITGGASGIGYAFARRFVEAGSRVVVCGRRADVLAQATRETPGLETIAADVSQESERVRLAEVVRERYPELNVLVNNAGIQNRPPSLLEPQDWGVHHNELATNVEAPLHLTMLLAQHLAGRSNATLINVTSGLAFVPIASMPTYCATKAALHSLTLSMRKQFEGKIEVIEVAPPAVQTDLGGVGLHTFGEPLEEYADFVFSRLAAGDLEFGYKFSEAGRVATFEERAALFSRMNG